MADAALSPVRAEERIIALDALRGVALCGILLMNLEWMSFISFNFHPLLPDPITASATIAFWVQHVLLEGTMRGLFSMLFGAGILLFMAKGEGAPAIRSLGSSARLPQRGNQVRVKIVAGFGSTHATSARRFPRMHGNFK